MKFNFFLVYVRDRTEPPASDEDSCRYDARGQNLGAVRRHPRLKLISRTPVSFGIP
jgi:hypothetical protein